MATAPHIATQWNEDATPKAAPAMAVVNSEASIERGDGATAKPHMRCVHCGQASPARFCCEGCRVVYTLLAEQGLTRYYDLRGATGAPPSPASVDDESLPAAAGNGCFRLAVEGVHCTACVWLCQELFAREPGARHIEVNASRGVIRLDVDTELFSLPHYACALGAFGYRLAADRGDRPPASRVRLWRIGVCAAIALNSMALSFAFYGGLDRSTPLLYTVFATMNVLLATAAVVVGGSVFLRSAWAAVWHRAMHIDVPIALGIVLAYGGSLAACLVTGAATTYFDSLCGFIALMLVGKYLPQRLLEINAAGLLRDPSLSSLQQRVRGATSITRVPASDIHRDDMIVLAVGDMAVVDVELASAAHCRLDWLTGESDTKLFAAGAPVPAGAFNAGPNVVEARALVDFANSSLHALLPVPSALRSDAQDRWMAQFSRIYVLTVLALAAGTFACWWPLHHGTALSATIAVLVVSCPCAIGLATPVAYEVIVSRLRRRGVFVHSARALDRLGSVNAVAFDKTGTLTGDALLVTNPDAIVAMSEADRGILSTMVALSNHPHAKAIAREAGAAGVTDLQVWEVAGEGLHAVTLDGTFYALRAAGELSELRRDERAVVRISFAESARAGTSEVLRALRRAGYALTLLSGDRSERVQTTARALGFLRGECAGGLSPQAKAEQIAKSPDRVLMVGDGINDTLAFAAAHLSAAPSGGQPCVPARADFHYVAPNPAPVTTALRAGRGFRRIALGNYALALAYNAVVLTLAAAGHMTPLCAAIVMPVSSVFIVGANIALARRCA